MKKIMGDWTENMILLCYHNENVKEFSIRRATGHDISLRMFRHKSSFVPDYYNLFGNVSYFVLSEEEVMEHVIKEII